MNSFYKDKRYIYPEVCIVKEIFNISDPGILKCYIPAIMPLIKEGDPKKVKFRPSNSHLDNDDTDGIEPSGDSHTANYILIRIPNHITDVTRDVIIIPEWNDSLFDIPNDAFVPVEEDESTEVEEDDTDGAIKLSDTDNDIQINNRDFSYNFTPDMFRPMFPLLRRLNIRKRYFFPLEKYDIEKRILYVKKNQRFIAVFIGGDINNIKITGRYDECQSQEPTLSPAYSVSEVPWISHITNLP